MKGVQILASKGITDEQLLPILKRKAPWIAKNYVKLIKLKILSKKEFVNGEKFST
ncbi:hypothetical protein [Bacillus sp. JJ63]|uniref:hypothetical protein n=1 Tax=Bacillus sp. JJ63 TaxID=3122968 RepID=UPI002FFF4EA0